MLLLLLAIAAPAWAQELIPSHQSIAPVGVFTNNSLLQPIGRPVARVNGSVLTDRDLLREMYAIFPYARQHNGTFPKAMEKDIRQGALKMIEFEELVYQEALRRGMSVGPARLEKAEAAFRQQFRSPEMYQMYLKAECKGERKVLRSKIRRSLLIEDLLKTEVEDKSGVSVVQAKTWFEKHPERFKIPESYAVQTISVVPAAHATPGQLKEAHKRADDFLRQANATKSYQEFGLLAEKISEDDYRVMMGDHRLMEATKLPPQLLAAVKKMQPGQVSDLIQVEQIFTVVRLNQHVPAGIQKFSDVRDSLLQNLQKQNVERLRTGLDSRLRRGAKIEEM